MPRIQWDQKGKHFYETGTKNGVLYLEQEGEYPNGVPWNGLIGVTESPSGAEETALYANDDKYISLRSKEELGGTIQAYTYPDEFGACDGSADLGDVKGVSIGQQKRSTFGLSYRSTVGNDSDGNECGYKLHLIYGASASPSERSYSSINDSPEAIELSWEFSTVPVAVSVGNHNKTSIVTIDTTKLSDAHADKLKDLEDILYGIEASEFSTTKTYEVGDCVTYTSGTPSTTKTYRCKTKISTPGAWDSTKWDEIENDGPRLPLPDEVYEIFAA